ncbi:MAG: hypothetical protein ACI3VE_04105 [Oscillospiraceae bacterium]
MEKGKHYYDLLRGKTKWNQLCASLYTIEDAQSAISAYSETDFPEDEKGMYLIIYGLLQSEEGKQAFAEWKSKRNA